ncbi:hypothetical protein V7139_29125 [Neobacillus drentensis]|uniref:hypothetical protein n=1 Tax=Neobacillus drentensis TaxID=220684 RepID=UPI003000509B
MKIEILSKIFLKVSKILNHFLILQKKSYKGLQRKKPGDPLQEKQVSLQIVSLLLKPVNSIY